MIRVIKVNNLPTRELVSGSTGEKLSIAASISDAFALSNLLVHRELLSSGRRTAPAHRHSLKEEMFLVESGTPSVWVDGNIQRLKPGDAVGFTPQDGMRMIFNDSAEDAIVWTIGTNEADDVIEYLAAL